MREGAVRIVGPVSEGDPRRPPPPRFWLFVVPVIAFVVVGWLLVRDTPQELSEFRTEYAVPGFDTSFESLREFLPPPQSAFGYRWSQVALFEGQSELTKVIDAGPSFVAVGSSSGTPAAWISVDGTGWSRATIDGTLSGGDSDESMNSVTVGGPGLVAVGHSISDGYAGAAVWTSVSGETWMRLALDESVFGGSRLLDVVAGERGLIAFGEDINRETVGVWTSVDGFVWSRVAQDEPVFASAAVNSVTVGGPGLVAVGHSISDRDANAVVWTSVDGLAWSKVPHDESVFGGEGDREMFDVVAGGPGLVAVGSSSTVWTSVDGLAWSRIPNVRNVKEPINGRPAIVSVASNGLEMVAVGGGGWFVGGVSGSPVWTSADGVDWSRFTDEGVFSADLTLVIASGPGFLLFNNYGVWAAVPLQE